eukprot:TRINITY_DN100973_c0_g1_i1.p1 TRINITY_DN100973_c0_g1~~TRINITY_DN100973_c0_g1_i1.p1  ORF type:complete len:872 (-),score=199.66 TRINITY_DN100973_c0_g1_i1:76-2691(-)
MHINGCLLIRGLKLLVIILLRFVWTTSSLQPDHQEIQISAAGSPGAAQPQAAARLGAADSLAQEVRGVASGQSTQSVHRAAGERLLRRQAGGVKADPLPPLPPPARQAASAAPGQQPSAGAPGRAVPQNGSAGHVTPGKPRAARRPSAKERAFRRKSDEIRASLAGALKAPQPRGGLPSYDIAGLHRSSGDSLQELPAAEGSDTSDTVLLGDGAAAIASWEPSPEEPFDCQAGLKAWKRGWSEEKKKWCCENRELGCEEVMADEQNATEMNTNPKQKRKLPMYRQQVEHFETGPSAKGYQTYATPFWENLGWYSLNGAWYEGAVRVKSPINDETTLSILTEENRACMQELSVFECMDRLGSYGLRKVFSYAYKTVEENGWERPDWMAHEAVQNKSLLSLTLPMSHASASFDVEGKHAEELGMGNAVRVSRQSYDIYQQLRLGVRGIDIDVAYNTRNKHLYAANGLLTISLARAFMDIKKFLDESTKEVIVLDLRKARLMSANKWGTLDPIEKRGDKELPAQIVHSFVQAMLGDYLADHSKLAGMELSRGGFPENPTVGDLVSVDARVIYFWEGQQVLCTSWQDCQRAPGWEPPALGTKFAFGRPMMYGTRPGTSEVPTTSRNAKKVMEPLCMNPSAPMTGADDPVMLLNALRVFSVMTRNVTYLKVPSCYPELTELPEDRQPPLVSRLDAWTTLSERHREEFDEILSRAPEDYVHGEALTARSNAERVNYLLLLWYFLKGNSDVYTRMNLISMDFVYPTIVHRIVAAMQDQPECGYAVHCVASGSCFTADLHSGEAGCLDYVGTQRVLWNHAEGRLFTWQTRYYTFFVTFVLVKMMILYSYAKASDKEASEKSEAPQAAAEGGGAQGGGSG